MRLERWTRSRHCCVLLALPLLVATAACDSPVVREAKEAEGDGRVISNEIMAGMYPRTFRSGNPPYLERDFEAGADFICDQIRDKYDRDICSEPEVGWR